MKTTTKVTVTKLNVKIGRNYVYLHTINADNNDLMSFGPSAAKSMFPYSFINNQNFDHRTKRLLRKALCAIGRADLAAYSVPSKKIGQKEMNRRVTEYRNERNAVLSRHQPYADSDHGDTASHNA